MSESITEYRNHYDRRDLLAQWYVVKNGDLTPDKVTSGSQEKVWWRCTQGHEWTSAPYERAKRGTGCPYCAGKRIPPGMDLVSVYPYLAKQAAAAFPDADIEILEIPHNRKVDAPSGTAKMLFEAVKEVRPQATANCGRSGEGKRTKDEIGISALRMGNVVGIHEVHICTPSQTLVLRHEAANRAMFADGAVAAANFLVGKPAGHYNMTHFLEG